MKAEKMKKNIDTARFVESDIDKQFSLCTPMELNMTSQSYIHQNN